MATRELNTTSQTQSDSDRKTLAITLKDVARLAGVSPMTVSRVLNSPELVSDKTRHAVAAAIDQTGYVRNSLAGGLTSRRTRLVAIIVPSIAHSLFSSMVQSLIDTLNAQGYQSILGLSGYDAHQEEALVETILSRRPDGIALTGTDHTARTKKLIISSGVAVVELWDHTPSPLDIAVGFSHEAVGGAACRSLAALGYKKLATLRTEDTRARRRAHGFFAATIEAKLAEPTEIVISESVPQSLRGKITLEQLRAAAPDTDAVFCSSDALAQGVLAQAHRWGLHVPNQLGILGFGDQASATDTIPALSTIKIDGEKIGRLAAENMVTRIEQPNTLVNRTVDLGFEVVLRATTKSVS